MESVGSKERLEESPYKLVSLQDKTMFSKKNLVSIRDQNYARKGRMSPVQSLNNFDKNFPTTLQAKVVLPDLV